MTNLFNNIDNRLNSKRGMKDGYVLISKDHFNNKLVMEKANEKYVITDAGMRMFLVKSRQENE